MNISMKILIEKEYKYFITDSVWCVVGVEWQAMTQVEQLGAGSVLG